MVSEVGPYLQGKYGIEQEKYLKKFVLYEFLENTTLLRIKGKLISQM